MGIIISNYFKFHFKEIINYPLFLITNNLKKTHNYSWKLINNFYNSIIYIINISPLIKNFVNCINKLKYNNESIENKIVKIKNMLNIVKSNFDTCYSSTPFYLKYHLIMKNNKNNITCHNQMITRMINIFKLLGQKFFNTYEIKLFTVEDFENLELKERVKYCAYVFNLTKSVLQNNIRYLELLLFHKQRLKNIINPRIIDIETKYTSSETDFEELCYF